MKNQESIKPILDASELKILSIFADTLIPSTQLLPEKPSELGIPEMVNDFLHYSSWVVAKTFRFALQYLEMRAYFFHSSMKRFSQMSDEERATYLESWQHSSKLHRMTLIRVLEAFVLSNYYSHPKVTEKIGYIAKLPNKTPSKSLYGDNVILNLPQNDLIEADVCIIGTGAGGAPMAAELAKAGMKVVILEEGGRFDLSDFKGDPVQRCKKMYREAGLTTTIGVPTILVPTGRAIGGTTTINSGTCFRTPDVVFKKWQENYGLNDITAENMAPYYERVEKTINVVEVPEELLGNSARLIRIGLEKMGIKGSPLKRNIRGCEGSGLCCFGCPTDAKQSVQLNYIPQALASGAKLYAHCKVQKLNHQNGRVTEVEAQFVHPITREEGSKLKVKAKIFVVAAGTINTPLLLKGSKLAGSSGEVGKNLTLHPAAKAFGLFDQEIKGWEEVPQSYYSSAFSDRGLTFEGIFTPPSVGSTTLLLKGKEHKQAMENYSHLASFGFLVMDQSRGRVWRRPNGEPIITYSLNKSDLKKMIDGTVLLSRMFFEAGAKEVYLPIHSFPKVKSIEEASQIYAENIKAKDLEVFAFHPLGTCRMGQNASDSVVDSYGKVHEMENLYISDGSIFPTSLGVNPQLTIMALSTRMADHIRQKHF